MEIQAKILIVEDEKTLGEVLADSLEDEGFKTHLVETGTEALNIMKSHTFDLVILDIMLPDTNGYNICKTWRDSGLDIPILMLTARGLDQDLVEGFKVGADDYVKKPYAFVEVLSRIKALLRRGKVQKNNETENKLQFQFGQYILDLKSRRMNDEQNNSIVLTKKEFDLIALFLKNPDSALSRDEILEKVWGEVVVESRTIDNFVSNLKKKFLWNTDSNWAIEAIRGVGYRFVHK